MPITVASETGKVLEKEFEGSLPTLQAKNWLKEDEELAERRGVLRFGSLTPC